MSDVDAPFIDPQEYAALVREASDEDLARGFEVNRDLILAGIFQAMPTQLNRDRAPRQGQFVSEWRITGRDDGGEDRWQVVITAGECQVVRDGAFAPDVTFIVGPVDFVRLVTGNASGPRMFFFGRLKITGDLLSAARYQTYFRTPNAKRTA